VHCRSISLLKQIFRHSNGISGKEGVEKRIAISD
jgi:hypothetical protein